MYWNGYLPLSIEAGRTTLEQQSFLMRTLIRFGFEPFAWSLRRLHCPVSKKALVLEVGSGGNPYPRSNVLLDAYEETRERHWVPLKSDRPTVLGFVENLPFKDKAFDFVIASHVLEHSSDPDSFLSELQRVAKAGYIEVPDAFMERVNPYRDHRLEVTVREGKLIIRKKPSWIVEPDTVALYEDRAKPIFTKKLISRYPFAFHVRFYWEQAIQFEIVNPEVDVGWRPLTETKARPVMSTGLLRSFIQKTLSEVCSKPHKNRCGNLMNLIRCPKCHGSEIKTKGNVLVCSSCSSEYPLKNGIPVMTCRNGN